MADEAISALTLDATPVGADLITTVKAALGAGSNRKATIASIQRIVQVVNYQTGALATGTTQIPFDDTIPQNTEGDEYLTLAITPRSTTNKLKIEVVLNASTGTAARYIVAALFQDSTAGALAATLIRIVEATGGGALVFRYYMAAGTTSATTFKVRAGLTGSGTTTVNGSAAGRIFGGVMISSLTITEILA